MCTHIRLFLKSVSFFALCCFSIQLCGMHVHIRPFHAKRDKAAAQRIGLEGVAGGISEAYRFLSPETTKVARVGNQTVGFIDYDMHEEDGPEKAYAYIAYLGVAHHMRGKGIGRILIECVMQDIQKQGLPYIKLHVTEDNTPAIRFYELMGFGVEKNEAGALAMLYKASQK